MNSCAVGFFPWLLTHNGCPLLDHHPIYIGCWAVACDLRPCNVLKFVDIHVLLQTLPLLVHCPRFGAGSRHIQPF